MDPVLTIQHASVRDIQLIRDLALQIWPQTYSDILSPQQISYMMDLIYSEAALYKQMENGHRFIIVLNANNPVGFASFSEVSKSIYKLHKIYLLRDQQGKGSGRFVIDQIIDMIKPLGADALLLNVNRNNKARSFYEKIGFEIIRSEDIDIGNGYFMNDYIMQKNL